MTSSIVTPSTKSPSVLGSLTLRLFALLFLLFIFIALIVYVIIEWQGKPKIQEMTAQTIIETGNEAVNDLMADISHVDGLAIATTAMSAALPKDDELFTQSIGSVMKQMDEKIVGGGVWFNPNTYDKEVERKSFVWERDASGQMVQTSKYDNEGLVTAPYYRDWWFIPTMYAEHNHCVWSRAYIDPVSRKPMMTCAKAMYNTKNRQFDAVVSFNVLLDNLSQMMESWQQRTGGYAFLVDLDNRFLTFPDESMVTEVTELNPQGEKIQVHDFATKQAKFVPIAQTLDAMNQALIDEAKGISEGQHTMTAVNIQTTANYKRILEDEALVLSALMLTVGEENQQTTQSNFVTQVALEDDFILGEPATAFVFRVPSTHWKMVIVKPQSELVAVANTLSRQLMLFMVVGFGLALLVSAWVFRRFLTQPLGRVVDTVSQLSTLIAGKRYLDLAKYKLKPDGVNEINTINHSVNQLVDKVVENEGALAEINVYLEKKVEERTAELRKAMEDLKASQAQLVQSEKMATLGQMVAGVAHEVNTPLGYVRSNLVLVDDNLSRFDELLEKLQRLIDLTHQPQKSSEQQKLAYDEVLHCCRAIQDDEVSNDLSEMIKDSLYGVDQIAELVVSLRDFSRIDASKIKAVDINECINTSLTMAKNNIKHLQIDKALKDLPDVTCNPSQVNQILLNLFNNAAQAMQDGQKGKIRIDSFARGDDVIITVTDNGKGMSQAVLSRIFEPFFTTKKAGEGTGLGLAICSQIMEQHNGSIEVESTEGVGTTFTLSFPRSHLAKQAAQDKPHAVDEDAAVVTTASDNAVFI